MVDGAQARDIRILTEVVGHEACVTPWPHVCAHAGAPQFCQALSIKMAVAMVRLITKTAAGGDPGASELIQIHGLSGIRSQSSCNR